MCFWHPCMLCMRMAEPMQSRYIVLELGVGWLAGHGFGCGCHAGRSCEVLTK